MKRIILLTLLFLCNFISIKAQKNDYVWQLGYASNTKDSTFGGTKIDFNFSPPKISYEFRKMYFFLTNASICNDVGNLLFYTNGIYIADSTNNPIKNGTELDTWEQYGNNINQGCLILPYPEKINQYILFHKRDTVLPIILSEDYEIYATTVDMNLNGGKGQVVEKNKLLIQDTLAEGFSAVKHANGKDWWIITPTSYRNSYHRLLLTSMGIKNMGKQTVGNLVVHGLGCSSFSSDGVKYARFNTINAAEGQRVDIYDFNRCTGTLSNQYAMLFKYPNCSSGSLCFSPNSRFLYVFFQEEAWQYDLWATDIAASKEFLGYYKFSDWQHGSGFHASQLGPDGKIYITCKNAAKYLHVIHNPDEKGKLACNFKQHDIELPTFNASTIPNFPNYRLSALSGCMVDTEDIEEEKKIELSVFPNPFSDQVKLSIKSNQSTDEAVQVTISDIMGRTIYQTYTSLQKGYNEVIVGNTSAWATGIYTYTIRSATDVASALFVKQ
jgi:hypothetical protein